VGKILGKFTFVSPIRDDRIRGRYAIGK